MSHIDLPPAVIRVAWWAFWCVTISIASLLLSALLPWIEALLDELRAALTKLRVHAGEAAREFVAPRLERWWRERARDPRLPVVAELSRATDAIHRIGDAQIITLSQVEERLQRDVTALTASGQSVSGPGALEAAAAAARSPSVFGAALLLLLALLFALTLGAINALLLNIFFREVLGNVRLLPYPLPDIQISHVAASLFFIIEVAAGMLLPQHANKKRNEDPGTTELILHRIVPWFTLAVLALIEAFAYGTLSARINLPAYLKLNPDSAFYGIAEYFMAGFGIALTMSLAGIGHLMAARFGVLRQALADRSARREIETLRRDLKSAGEQHERIQKSLTSVREQAAALPMGLAESYRQAVGLPAERATLADSIQTSIIDPLKRGESDDPLAGRSLRTRGQIIGEVLVGAISLAVLVVVVRLTVAQIADFIMAVRSHTAPLFAWSVAVVGTAGVLALGIWSRSVLAKARYTAAGAESLPSHQARRAVASALLAALCVTVLLYAVLEVQMRPAGDAPALNGLLGVFQAAVLIALACFLDQILVASWNGLHAALLLVVRLASWVLAGTAILIEGACFAIRWLLRLLSVPGQAIRAAVGGRSATLPRPVAS